MADVNLRFTDSPTIQVELAPPTAVNVDVKAVGPTGPAGIQGPAGVGVPTGGAAGQVLAKNSSTNYDTIWVNQTGGGGGGGGVSSVNGNSGPAVVLTQDNIGDGTTYKQYSQTEKTKLAGIATGATANSTDAQLRDRSTHTGTQLAATISDLSKASVGLGNVDNTSDANKPVSTATQTALNGKEPTITAGTSSQYYRGDKTFQTLDKSAVGLSAVDNTSDANKPISTATQTALNAKVSDLTDSVVSTPGTLVAGLNSGVTAAGTYAAPTPAATVTTPPQRFAITNRTTGTVTLSFPNPAGTTINLTVLAGEVLTMRQVTTSGYVNESGNKPLAQLDARYQALLVSGTNIRTVNGSSLLGSGDLVVSGGGSSPLTTKGDLYGYSTANARVPIGTDGQVLTADSASALGLKWANAASGFTNPMTTAGDIIYGGTGGTPTRLATGTGFLRGGATPAYSLVVLASDVSGTLPVANGGTGTTTSTGTGNTVLSASPTFTGTPAAPTATAGTNTTQLATTAFSAAAITAERSAAVTLTNKRITQRVTSLAAGTSYTPAGDTSDEVIFAAPTGAFTIANLTGTPVNGDKKIFRMLTGSTPFAATWGTVYVGGNGNSLPTTFPANSTVNMLFKYDSTLAKWVLLSTDLPQTFYTPIQVKAYRRVTAATTITSTDGFISADASTAAFNVTLPAASSVPGQRFTVKKWNTSANDVTVVGTIDGSANYVLSGSLRPAMDFISNGTDYEKA